MPNANRLKSQQTREVLAHENFDAKKLVSENREVLNRLSETPYRLLGQKLVKGEHFTFEEAFLAMTYVVCATNKGIFKELRSSLEKANGVELAQKDLIGPAQSILTGLAIREASRGEQLQAEEIAGMVASALMDRVFTLSFSHPVIETGGMGGDKGYVVHGKKQKVINASTLSALTLSALGVPVIKHGSYANTSAVGSTEAIEKLGVNIFQSSKRNIKNFFAATNFYFSDAHIAKTIHDLSHHPLLRHETINHIIGPMTPPIAKDTVLNKVIGINEGVHPATIARAYEILHEKGYQKVGNVAVVSGLGETFNARMPLNDLNSLRPQMLLDELSPYASLLGIVQNGKYQGSFLVTPKDFGIEISSKDIQVQNSEDNLLQANIKALSGNDPSQTKYLAMNAALGLFVHEYLERKDAIVREVLNKKYLQEAYRRCYEVLASGLVIKHLSNIIDVSQGKDLKETSVLRDVDLVIFDIDNTLVKPKDPSFYAKYSQAVDRAVSRFLEVDITRGKEIADFYRQRFGGGERALFDGTLGQYFPEFKNKGIDYTILYEEMCKIDPSGQFAGREQVRKRIQELRVQGKKIIALTDSPEDLSRRVLKEVGIDPEKDFDGYYAYTPEGGPKKHLKKERIFVEIAQKYGVSPQRILSVGDTYYSDILPAVNVGMKTCLISSKIYPEYTGMQVQDVEEVLNE